MRKNNAFSKFWLQPQDFRLQVNNFKLIILRFALVACALQFVGCGYSAAGAYLPAGIKTIYVKPFVNKIDITSEITTLNKYQSYRPLLEVDITKKLIDRFILGSALKIAKIDSADWIIEGGLIEFRRDPLKYADDDETVLEYRINIVVSLNLYNKENKLVWSEPGFIGNTTYFTQGTLAKSETTAVNDAVVDLARRIVERVVENW